MKRTRILLALILSLVVVSGCASQVGPKLIAPTSFVQENLVRLMAAETKQDRLLSEIKMVGQFGVDTKAIKKEFLNYRDLHWVHFFAAQTYLVNGDLDLFVQAVAKAEHYTQKAQDLLDKQIKNMAPLSVPEVKRQSL